MKRDEFTLIEGANGGGGGKGHSPVTAPNDLRTQSTARVLFLMGYGENGGLYDQEYPLKSVFIDNVPVQNADGTYNKNNAVVKEVYGLPSQEVLPGFASISDTAAVGQKVTTSTPITYTTSTANVDAVRVTVRIPALYKQEDNGDTNGASVQISLWRAVGSGSYSKFGDFEKSGKSIAPADVDYNVPRPPGSSGVWSVQMRRATADSTNEKVLNDTYFQFATEIQEVNESYDGYAVIGLTTTADTGGASYPTVAFDYVGRLVKVPSNYNAGTRTYSGVWNGLFKSTKEVCDNPAWILYDMITDPVAGMGDFVKPADVNAYSFYDAAVYNDQLVPDGKGGQEPRFTFNADLMDQDMGWSQVQRCAASSLSMMVSIGGKISLIQDRPTGWSRLITNSNVIQAEDGEQFSYSASSATARTPACIVNWSEPAQNWIKVPAYYQDDDAVERYGFSQQTIDGIGVTTEGQALRLARWYVDTAINQTETVSFKVGFQNATLGIGEVFKLADADLAEVMLEAKVVSSTSTQFVLDRTVAVSSGDTLDVTAADGVTTLTRSISTTSTGSTISFSGGALSVNPGATVVLSGVVSPRLFKVTSIKENSAGNYEIGAVEYDSNKFARVDNTPSGPVQVYQLPASMSVVPPVSDITFKEESYTNPEGLPKRKLAVTWIKPAGQLITSYVAFWFKDSGTPVQIDCAQAMCYVPVDTDGSYSVTVYALNARGVRSAPATAQHSVNLSLPSAASELSPVTDLHIKGGALVFTGTDATLVWDDPNTNTGAVVVGYEVKVLDALTSSTVYRTEFVTKSEYTYDLAKQQVDNGANLKRTFIASVRVKDTWGRYSTALAHTFSNPTPALLEGIAVTSGIGNVKIVYTLPTDTDFAGVLTWRSTTSGFTPSTANLLYDDSANYVTDTAIDFGATYYYRLAAYDTFSKPLDGAGLNVSTQFSAVALAPAGIPEVSSLPTVSGYTGPKIVFLTTNGKLYSLVSGAWEETIPAVSGVADGSITVTKFASTIKPVEVMGALPTSDLVEGRVVYLTTDDKLYRYTGTAWTKDVPAVDVTGQLTNAQLADIAAAKVTGQLVSSQIADAAVTTAKLASTIRAPEALASLPSTGNTQGRLVLLTTDNKLYRWTGGAWTSSVPAVDLTGQLTDAQVAAVAASKVTGQLADAQIAAVAAAKITGTLANAQIADVAASKITGAISDSQIAAVAAAKVTGALVNAQIADIAASKVTGTLADSQIAAVAASKVTGTIADAQIAAVAAAKVTGTLVNSQIADLAATKITGTLADAQIAAVAASKLTGQITSTQITDGSITTPKLVSNSITTDKLLVTGRGKALNDDPNLMDPSAWAQHDGAAATYTTVTDGVSGLNVVRFNGMGAIRSRTFAVTGSRQYRVSVWVRRTSGSGQAYLRMPLYNASGGEAGFAVTKLDNSGTWESFAPGSTWGRYVGYVVTPSSAVNGAVVVYGNYNTTGVTEAQDLRVEEYIGADLIVDGAITAAKVAAGTITGDRIAGSTITGSNIQAGSIQTGNLAADAVKAGVIAANAVTSTAIAADSITASKIAVVPSNLCPDPDFLDQAYWSQTITPNGWYFESQATFGAMRRMMTLWSGSNGGPGTAQKLVYTFPKPFSGGGQVIRLRARCANNSNQHAYAQVEFMGPGAYDYISSAAIGFAAGSGHTVGSTQVTAPTNTTHIRFVLYNQSGSTFSGYTSFTDITANIAASADLIVDGAITAVKIAADTITSAQIAANAITSSELAAGAVTAGKITAGTVSTTELAAGAVTATNIAAGSVLASKIVVQNNDSVFPDPGWYDRTWWTGGGGTAPSGIYASEYSLWPVRRVLTFNGNLGSYDFYTAMFPTESGATYRYKVTMYMNAAFTGTFGVHAHWPSQAWFEMGIPRSGTVPNTLSGISIPRDGWQTYTSNFTNTTTSGAGQNESQFRFSGNQTAGAVYVAIEMVRAASADLIVDGAITATKVSAGSITGDRIAGNTITAGNIAGDQITAYHIAAQAVTADELAANSVVAGKVAAAAIGADQIQAAAIRTDKLFVTGRGRALNEDPGCMDQTAWRVNEGTGTKQFLTGQSLPIGTTSIRCTNGTQLISRRFPIQAGLTYKVAHWARQVSGGGVLYTRLRQFNADGTEINYGPVTGLTPTTAALEGLTVPSSWTYYDGYVVPVAGSVMADIILHVNWYVNDGSSVTDVTDIRCEEYVGADLIVDGSIAARKITANSITGDRLTAGTITGDRIAGATITGANIQAGSISADRLQADSITAGQIAAGAVGASEVAANAISAEKIQADAITSVKIAAGAITTDKLAANSVTAGAILASTIDSSKIVAGSITGDRFAANTITGDKIAAGTVTANNIDSRGLSIRDSNGAVILAAGSALHPSYAASGTQNSAITVSNGVINGIGAGSGAQVDNSFAVSGQNLIPNSDYTNTFAPLVLGWNPNGAVIDQPLTYASNIWSETYVLVGSNTRNVVAHQNNILSGGDGAIACDFHVLGQWGPVNSVPVIPGERVIFSAYVGTHRSNFAVGVGFWDAAGSNISNTESSIYGATNNSTDALSKYARPFVVAVAPAGSATMSTYIRKYNTNAGSTESWIWMAAPQLEKVASNVSNPSPYQSGPTLKIGQLGYTGELNATYGAVAGSTLRDSGGDVLADGAVKNTAISVGQNGVLYGAGGGQVTIGGLGYSGALNASSDLQLNVRGTCSVSGNNIYKNSGANAWDSDAYNNEPYQYGCIASATINSTSWAVMFGLNSDPWTDASYASIDYAMYFEPGGNVFKYESGAGVHLGSYPAGSTGQVYYDGSYVRYILNGNQIGYTYVGNINRTFYFDSSLATPGSVLTNCRFVPVGNPSAVQVANPITSGNASTFIANAAINTAQIGSLNASVIQAGSITTDRLVTNAVTAAASGSSAGQVFYGSNSAFVTSNAVTMYSFTSTGVPAYFSGSFNVSMNATSASTIAYFVIEIGITLAGLYWTTGSAGWMQNVTKIGSSYLAQLQTPAIFRSPTPYTGANDVRYTIRVTAKTSGGQDAVMTSSTMGITWASFTQENKV